MPTTTRRKRTPKPALKFTAIRVPTGSGIMEDARKLAKILESQSGIPGATVHIYSAVAIALTEAIDRRSN
jgi:hypothetical protein